MEHSSFDINSLWVWVSYELKTRSQRFTSHSSHLQETSGRRMSLLRHKSVPDLPSSPPAKTVLHLIVSPEWVGALANLGGFFLLDLR